MRYRLLKDKDKFYPQRKGRFQIHWKYYTGHPYTDKRFSTSVSGAIDIIEENKEDDEKHRRNVLILIFMLCPIIAFILLLLRKVGMI